MNTQDVANKFIALCREGKNMQVVEELYADNIISKEMSWMPGETVTEGKQAVTKKNTDWLNNVEEFHSGNISDPIVAGNHFSCKMDFDVTFKDRGRQQMEEVCVYEVKDGKIINEQFFYSPE
jgi:hypothetical protein